MNLQLVCDSKAQAAVPEKRKACAFTHELPVVPPNSENATLPEARLTKTALVVQSSFLSPLAPLKLRGVAKPGDIS